MLEDGFSGQWYMVFMNRKMVGDSSAIYLFMSLFTGIFGRREKKTVSQVLK